MQQRTARSRPRAEHRIDLPSWLSVGLGRFTFDSRTVGSSAPSGSTEATAARAASGLYWGRTADVASVRIRLHLDASPGGGSLMNRSAQRARVCKVGDLCQVSPETLQRHRSDARGRALGPVALASARPRSRAPLDPPKDTPGPGELQSQCQSQSPLFMDVHVTLPTDVAVVAGADPEVEISRWQTSKAREGQPSAGSNPAATALLTRGNAGLSSALGPAFQFPSLSVSAGV